MNVKIIADSTCDLPQEVLDKFDIDIVPLYVILDEESYKDSLEIDTEKLINWSNETKQTPKTSAPSVDDFMTAFKPYIKKKQDIVFISISSELSATCQSANLAKDMVSDITVKVVDGRSVSLGTGLIVYKAAQMAKEGLSADEIEAKLAEIIPNVSAGFVLDTLEFLRRGGRCSALKAFAASSLKLRPEIITVDGKLVPGGKFRGSMDKVVKSYFNKVLSNTEGIDPDVVFVVSTKDEKGLAPMSVDIVKASGYFNTVIASDAGCVITAHGGPSAYGMFYIKK